MVYQDILLHSGNKFIETSVILKSQIMWH